MHSNPAQQAHTYALDRNWVDKDPRLCITYPAFLHILLRRVPLVVALRDPCRLRPHCMPAMASA